MAVRSILQFALAAGISLLCFNTTFATEPEGRRVFNKWCAGCHADSPFTPGTIQLKQIRSPELVLIEQRTDLSAEYIRHLVRKGVAGMPSFRRTEISNAALDALVDHLTRRLENE